jgi:hypothetical protein
MGEITVGTPLRGLSPSGSTAHGAVSTASDLAETPGKTAGRHQQPLVTFRVRVGLEHSTLTRGVNVVFLCARGDLRTLSNAQQAGNLTGMPELCPVSALSSARLGVVVACIMILGAQWTGLKAVCFVLYLSCLSVCDRIRGGLRSESYDSVRRPCLRMRGVREENLPSGFRICLHGVQLSRHPSCSLPGA